MNSRIDERLKMEQKRISKIWKKMLESKKAQIEQGVDSALCEFQVDEADGSTGGLGTSSNKFIKLPKHYEPSMFAHNF